jgi:uncharacterized membrane protein
MSNSESVWFMALYIITGIAMIAVSIPLLMRSVKPNHWYGFRTSKTLSSEPVWYKANAFAGALMLSFGIIYSIASIKFYFLLGENPLAYALTCLAMLLAGLLVITLLSFHYLRSL